MSIGPVQMLILGFEDPKFTGENLAELDPRLVRLDVRERVAQHRFVGAGELSKGERIGSGPVEDEEDLAVPPEQL